MSEHVLCMVLYLIELGLDNQVQDNKEDEVSFPEVQMSSCDLCRKADPKQDVITSMIHPLHHFTN